MGAGGDGHVAPKSERLKESEDEFFRFVFTFIDGAGDKGWTTHYRARHMPLAPEFQAAGFGVFYDGFYPEQLGGKDLVSFFDYVYRKASRHCVMFVSQEYADRMWTNHERRSAQARALEDRGADYILPIRVDDTDLDGLPPTVGYLSLNDLSVAQIADLLIQKLRENQKSGRRTSIPLPPIWAEADWCTAADDQP